MIWGYILGANLNNAWFMHICCRQQRAKVKIVREHNPFAFRRPLHYFGIRTGWISDI